MPAPQVLQNRYHIVTTLSQCGGFGITYRAVDTLCFDQPCVVKQLRLTGVQPETLPILQNMFETEARHLYSLGQYPQIPTLYAHFEESQDFFIVQEFIDGTSLRDAIRVGEPWPVERVKELLRDILTPLQVIHDHQVIHRDLKPDNLIRRQSNGQMVIIDFGAVKQLRTTEIRPDGRTQFTKIIGTPPYMPAEQFAGWPKFASDIYAVGIIVLEALTGCKPEDLLDYRTSDDEIDWQRHLSCPIDQTLAAIIDKMVCFDYRDRFQSVAEVLAALNGQLTSVPAEPLSSYVRQVLQQDIVPYINPNTPTFQERLAQLGVPALTLTTILTTAQAATERCMNASKAIDLEVLQQQLEQTLQLLRDTAAPEQLENVWDELLSALILPLLHCRGTTYHKDFWWTPNFELRCPGVPTAVVFTSSGQLISAGMRQPITLWEAGQPIRTLPQFGEAVHTISLSADDQWLAVASQGRGLTLWHRPSDRRIDLRGSAANMCCLAFHPQSHIIASGGEEGDLRLWDLEQQISLLTLEAGIPIRSLEWSPDGQWLACGLESGSIDLVNPQQSLQKRLKLRQGYAIRSLTFAALGHLLLSAGEDGYLRVWSVQQQQECSSQKIMSPLRALSISADQSLIASGSAAGTLRLWTWKAKQLALCPLGRIPQPRLGQVMSLAMHPSGRQIAVAQARDSIQIWCQQTRRQVVPV